MKFRIDTVKREYSLAEARALAPLGFKFTRLNHHRYRIQSMATIVVDVPTKKELSMMMADDEADIDLAADDAQKDSYPFVVPVDEETPPKEE